MITIALLALMPALATAQDDDSGRVIDDNTAFYEGATLSYIISPPNGFVMVEGEAAADGYSFAFVSEDETYGSASMLIGVNIFRIKEDLIGKISLGDIIAEDTSAIRQHFGSSLSIYEVDSVVTKAGLAIHNIYLNDTTRFIPNIMVSYLNGGTEILIFELSHTQKIPRFMAEQVYMECLERIKILVKNKLEAG